MDFADFVEFESDEDQLVNNKKEEQNKFKLQTNLDDDSEEDSDDLLKFDITPSSSQKTSDFDLSNETNNTSREDEEIDDEIKEEEEEEEEEVDEYADQYCWPVEAYPLELLKWAPGTWVKGNPYGPGVVIDESEILELEVPYPLPDDHVYFKWFPYKGKHGNYWQGKKPKTNDSYWIVYCVQIDSLKDYNHELTKKNKRKTSWSLSLYEKFKDKWQDNMDEYNQRFEYAQLVLEKSLKYEKEQNKKKKNKLDRDKIKLWESQDDNLNISDDDNNNKSLPESTEQDEEEGEDETKQASKRNKLNAGDEISYAHPVFRRKETACILKVDENKQIIFLNNGEQRNGNDTIKLLKKWSMTTTTYKTLKNPVMGLVGNFKLIKSSAEKNRSRGFPSVGLVITSKREDTKEYFKELTHNILEEINNIEENEDYSDDISEDEIDLMTDEQSNTRYLDHLLSQDSNEGTEKGFGLNLTKVAPKKKKRQAENLNENNKKRKLN